MICSSTRAAQVAGWGSSVRRFQVIDCHAAGEPARVVVGGLPHIDGKTMNEKRLRMMEPEGGASLAGIEGSCGDAKLGHKKSYD